MEGVFATPPGLLTYIALPTHVFVPPTHLQVANVVRARSADGLSAVSFELESWAMLVHTAYGYLKGLPFSTYGEATMLFAQNVLLLALIYKYARMPLLRQLGAITVAGGAVAAVVTGKRRDKEARSLQCCQHLTAQVYSCLGPNHSSSAGEQLHTGLLLTAGLSVMLICMGPVMLHCHCSSCPAAVAAFACAQALQLQRCNTLIAVHLWLYGIHKSAAAAAWGKRIYLH